MVASLGAHLAFLATPHAADAGLQLVLPWALQFIFSWIGFSIYIAWDYASFSRGTLEEDKLPSRHPIHESPVSLPPGVTMSDFVRRRRISLAASERGIVNQHVRLRPVLILLMAAVVCVAGLAWVMDAKGAASASPAASAAAASPAAGTRNPG